MCSMVSFPNTLHFSFNSFLPCTVTFRLSFLSLSLSLINWKLKNWQSLIIHSMKVVLASLCNELLSKWNLFESIEAKSEVFGSMMSIVCGSFFFFFFVSYKSYKPMCNMQIHVAPRSLSFSLSAWLLFVLCHL